MAITDQPRCPACGEARLVEQIGRIWFCQVCAHTFPERPVEAEQR